MKHKGSGHTGRIRHSDMVSLKAIQSHGGKDSLAHESHAAQNKAHMTGNGFSPPDEYEGEHQEGISGSGGNCCYE